MTRKSSQNHLTKSKTPNRGRTKRKNKTPEQQFADLHERIQRFEKQNEKLRARIAELFEQYKLHVSAEEKRVSEARYAESLRLISFIPRKSLSNWQKEVLIDWVAANIRELHANPFTDDLNIAELETSFRETLENAFPGIAEEFTQKEQTDQTNDKQKSNTENTEEYQEDLFGFYDDEDDSYSDDFSDEDREEEERERAMFEEFRRSFEQIQEEQEQELKDQQSRLNKLFKSTTVSKMFRQLSKHFHPDLEQDEKIKAEKHEKMSKLLEARRNHDVLAIISMHTTAFGSNDEQFATDDIKQLIPLLKYQLEQLQQQKDEIIFEDVVQGTIYEQFNAKSPKTTLQKMIDRKLLLQEEAQILIERATYVTSIPKLKPYLEARYDDRMRDMMLARNFIDDLEDIPF